MISWTKLAAVGVALFAAATLTARADEAQKPADGGKGVEHKSKAYDIKVKGQAAVERTFEAGKEVTVTTKDDANTDIHLLMKSKYYEWKDTSPSPVCLLKFTPVSGDDKFTFTIKNQGAADCQVTLDVKVADAEAKAPEASKDAAAKSETYDLKDGDEAKAALTFEANKEVTVTTKGEKSTDVHLTIKSKYYEWKDTSPSPVCVFKFTPVQGDDQFAFTIKNSGGSNKVTLTTQVAK